MTATIDIAVPLIGAADAIDEVAAVVAGLPVYIAGSAVAARHNQLEFAFDDVDVFCASPQSLISTAQKLLDSGYQLDDRMSRVWVRWLKYGFKSWHTNSLKLASPGGIKVNLVYKLVDGHPTTSLAQVIESFDFGLLSQGYDCEYGIWRDLQPYLFEGTQQGDPLPLMPNKRTNWRSGFISQYNGLREVGRYVKYHDYGYDMSLVRDDLITGYWAAAEYLTNRTDHKEKVTLGQIYESIAMHMEDDNWDRLRDAGKQMLTLDELDRIMEALE